MSANLEASETVSAEGDDEKQAALRNAMIKKGKKESSKNFSKLLSAIRLGVELLDIGCGAAHIAHELAMYIVEARKVNSAGLS